MFKTSNESLVSFFSIKKLKELFNRIKNDSVTLKISKLFGLYLFFVFLILMFLICLIFLASEIIQGYGLNYSLGLRVNRLEQELQFMRMSNDLLIDFFKTSGLIDESIVSGIREGALS